MMRYASVCDGIGAVHVAWKPLGWECAWTSEIEAFPAAVVEQRHGYRNLGDMTKLTEEQLDGCGPVSLLCGGTPCQSFSVAGLRKGLADPRGNLALRFVQLVGVLRPTWVVWENVPGVLSSAGGRDFGTFLGALAELGYGFAYRVLDAQWFGVAQRRRRVFVVAHARDWRRAAAVLFERESLFGDSPTRGEARQDASGSTGDGFEAGGRLTAFHPTQDPISSDDGSVHALGTGSGGGCASAAVAFTAKDHGGDASEELGTTMRSMGHDGSHANGGGQLAVAQPIDLRQASRGEKDTNNRGHGSGGPPGVGVGEAGDPAFTVSERGQAVGVATDLYNGAVDGDVTHSVRVGNGNAMGGVPSVMQAIGFDGFQSDSPKATHQATVEGTGPLIRSRPHCVATPMAVRRLTPRECERLQGFPDDYTLVSYRGKPAADGPRYKALGNSMAVPVMAWIGRRIAEVEVLP